MAELVHKVHLLCLLARGRIVDKACDDPLIQVILYHMGSPPCMILYVLCSIFNLLR